jgi:hypothetical protein
VKYALLIIFFISCESIACNDPRNVSLISLIASAEKYDQKCVWVSGYMHAQFEDSRLYLSKEHADRLFTENSIWIDGNNYPVFDSSVGKIVRESEIDLNAKWLSVRGVFNFNSKNNFLPSIVTTKVVMSDQVFDGSTKLTER